MSKDLKDGRTKRNDKGVSERDQVTMKEQKKFKLFSTLKLNKILFHYRLHKRIFILELLMILSLLHFSKENKLGISMIEIIRLSIYIKLI